MKAYFTASVVGKKQYLDNYQKIIQILKSKKIEVISDHIINATEEQIRLETKEERLAFYSKLKNWIRSADFVVVEATFPSISVGFEISMAIHMSKPVLALYANGDPPSILAGNHEEKMICEKYSLPDLKSTIEDFLNFVHATNDMRFTFFLPINLNDYLEEKSQKERIPKSVYLRNLIKKDMGK